MMLNYVKYLSRFGWTPIVLCGKLSLMEATDYSSLKEVHKNISVYRRDSLENKIINFLGNMNFFPSRKIGWMLFILITDISIVINENV